MKAHTVDRKRGLVEDQVIGLVRYSDLDPPELQAHMDELFPDGVSFHGDFYFLNSELDERLTICCGCATAPIADHVHDRFPRLGQRAQRRGPLPTAS